MLKNFNLKRVYRVYPKSVGRLSGQILRSGVSIKLLMVVESGTLGSRDNQRKPKNNYDLNSLVFMGLSGAKILSIFVNCT
jgi:hypothetical protein